jgi:hypothetical protein
MNAPHLRLFQNALLALGLVVLGTTAALAQTGGVYQKLSGKCRIGSSFGQGGPGFLPQATDRSLSVLGSASFTSQGGNGNTTGGNSSAGCGLPSTAIAVVISTSVVPRGQGGTLKVFEAGKAAADGNSVAFNTVDATTNDMIVPLRSPDVGTEITINSSRPVDYVLDVVGYFEAQTMECVSTAQTSVSIVAGGTANANSTSCAAGYVTTSTECETNSWDAPLVFASSGTCSAQNNGQSSATLRASRRCCRVQ